MPQPYRGDGQAIFAAETMLSKPELGAPIAAISNLWTLSEDMWGVILAAMLGVESNVGLAMYHTLLGTGSQRYALNQMAKLYLDPTLLERFHELMARTTGRAAERNAIVHGLWFYDPKIPDALILVPRNVFSRFIGKILTLGLNGQIETQNINPIGQLDTKGWLVYKNNDFLNTKTRLIEFLTDLDDFFDKILAAKGLPPLGPPARPIPATSS